MKIEYLGMVSYERTTQMCGFLLHTSSEVEGLSNNKVILFGTETESFIARKFLEEKNYEVDHYIDSFQKKHGNIVNGKQVISPYEYYNEKSGHIIVAVGKKNINSVRLQLKLYNIQNYSIFFIERFHDFNIEGEKELHDLVIDSINKISLDEKTIEEVAPVLSNVSGQDLTKLGNLNYLLYSTTWSNHVYKWIYEQYKDLYEEHDVLDIGPGYGLLSMIIAKLASEINIDWICFSGHKENSERNKFSGINLNTIYGIIESNEFLLNKKYDTIIMTEVFEHFVANPLPTMKKISDALKKDGKIYFTTPNWGHLYIHNTWEDMKEYTEFESKEEYLSMYCGHTYQYSKDELVNIFNRCNLKVERYELSDANNHNFLLSKDVCG